MFLGVLYRDVGSISLVIEAYEQCLKIDPDSHMGHDVTFEWKPPNLDGEMQLLNANPSKNWWKDKTHKKGLMVQLCA